MPFIVSYTRPLIYDPPRQLDVFGSAAAYFGLDAAAGCAEYREPEQDLRSGEIGLEYTNTTKALGGVDHEKGIEGRIVAATDQAEGEFFPQALRRPQTSARRLPWSNSSAWLYTHAGISRRISATARWPLIISALSATITSMTGPRSGTARWRASPASTSTRLPRASSAG